MMRFDYLRDAPPAFVERLKPARIPHALRTPLAALLATIVIVASWWGVETLQIGQAGHELAVQKARAAASRADLAQIKVRRSKLDALVALDARVRTMRRSGAVVANRFADVANHVPERAWLTSIGEADGVLDIQGDAIGLDGLSTTLADLLSSQSASQPSLVRAGRDDHVLVESVLSFQIHARERVE
jgi:Tfp pilus assembly protein PilN